MKKLVSLFVILAAISTARAQTTGVPISYALPPTPGQTYTVTLAVTDANNPDWIVSTFLSAAPRTVTVENKGKFSEVWNGLDDNFMPVPPGKYGIKGIFMPAKKWAVDGEYHSVTPKFVTGAGAWMPTAQTGDKPEPYEPFGGDPVGQPLGDIDVGPNGVAVFYYAYLENGLNNPMVDLKKPVGYEQFIRAFKSGGAGGGTSVATDGETVWAFSTDGGPKYVYRADEKPFGKSPGANRSNAYLPEGWVAGMAAWRDETLKKSFVYVAQRGKMVDAGRKIWRESPTEFVDKITVHDGEDGKVLAELPLARAKGLVARNGVLYALHGDGAGTAVSSVKLAAGLPIGTWQKVFSVPATIQPADLEVDSSGRFYLSDSKANKVYQLDGKGKVTLTYGRLDEQKGGTYDPQSFISPSKLATWKDAEGNDRLLVVEAGGPNRSSEWSADGKFIRDFLSLQTKANSGYSNDPDHPEFIYIAGHQNWLTRFKVDYASGKWTVDAVWPNVGNDPRAPGMVKPQFIRANGHSYIAGARSYNVYREAGDRWLLSAAMLVLTDAKNKTNYALWNDANGNGRVDDEEIRPTQVPGGVYAYHGQNWLPDLSMAAVGLGTKDVWRLAPSGYDAHGNPIFKEWTKLLTDPIFEAREKGKADATHGGNELVEKYTSDWMQVDGTMEEGFYVQARGGRGSSANHGAQGKVSRYVPDGKGGYKIKWRVGRAALQGTAKPGEMYGPMRIHWPLNGLVSVIDQTRMGIVLFTDDGLYVDTLFPDIKTMTKDVTGIYQLPGEFFAGSIFPNKDTGEIYFGLGKRSPLIYKASGWSLRENPVRRLTDVQKEVTISSTQISSPPEAILALRGGAGVAKFARFAPALGEVALDGSMAGWESVDPITFAPDKVQSVEVRGLYRPDKLFLRWHARLGSKFTPKPLPALERIFTHDQEADTLSFYIQGDVNAKPGGKRDGRPGDARFVFGLFTKDGKLQPVALGLYPEWKGAGAKPQIYRTPVGQASFAHAGSVAGAEMGYALDADGKGFVLTAAIPRAAIPSLEQPLVGGLRTLVNFEATFAGHNKFWWANSDGSASLETFDEPSEASLYPGSWAQVQLSGIEGGVLVRKWLAVGPFGGPIAKNFSWRLLGTLPGTTKSLKQAAAEFYGAATYPPDGGKVDLNAVYTGEQVTGYWGGNSVRWRPVAVPNLDQRLNLGSGGQVWHAATWVKVPVDTELEVKFLGQTANNSQWLLNGQPIPLKFARAEKYISNASKTLTLKAGWNQFFVRGYSDEGAIRPGLIFNGPTEKLMTLGLSATPPIP
jgi:hypothetical protein